MKYIITFIVLISLAFCEPPVAKAVPAEEVFTELKKNILECIVKAEKASPELKKYATETLEAGFKETLNLSQFTNNNDSDRLIVRTCRRQAYTYTAKKRAPILPLAPKEKVKPKMDN